MHSGEPSVGVKVPAPQADGPDAPVVEYKPGGASVHVVALDAFTTALEVPAAHGVTATAPSSQ